ncbi:NACHT domain-containing protein [Desulfococcaceae bacterium HSG7]|nr:NACHT domain-containing protein [Desulfococcaceae bacterium HSG7]
MKRLITQCDQLDISAIDEAHSDDHESAPLRISDVFTTLVLKDIERLHQSLDDVIRLAKSEHKKRVPVQAIQAAGAVNRLVILGRPGGGKSTLVNHIAGQLARLRKGDAVSEKALPGWTSDRKPLPVRIIMRQFAEQMPDDDRQTSERIVWEFIEHQLKEMGCEKFFPALQHTLDEDGGVIFFDGLDEVSEADKARKRIIMVKAIQEFAESLTKCRIIITCREYAYRKDDAWRLPEFVFPVVELDLFRAKQIKAFTRTWYLKTGPRKGWTEQRCLYEAENPGRGVIGPSN